MTELLPFLALAIAGVVVVGLGLLVHVETERVERLLPPDDGEGRQ